MAKMMDDELLRGVPERREARSTLDPGDVETIERRIQHVTTQHIGTER